MLKTYDVVLDIEKELYTISNLLFSVSRNDADSVQLNLKIMQDNEPANLTNTIIELGVKKPSGKTVFQSAEITDAIKGEASLILSIQAYIEYGIHMAELYIRTEDKMLVSSPFWYSSREAIMQAEEIDSINDWTALQDALLNYDKKPLLVEGIPTAPPEYIGQTALDVIDKRIFFAKDNTADSWELIGAGEGGAGVVRWQDILSKPEAFTPEAHTHEIEEINGLQSALDAAGETGGDGVTDWTEIDNKPLTFPPDVHTHEIADVNNLQTQLDTKASAEDLTGKADAAHSHSYAEITDKPATYPAEEHSHSFAEITDKPATYPAEEHSHSYAEITDKPTTFTPEAHTHEIIDVNGLQTSLNTKATTEDLAGKADAAHSHTYAEITDKPATFTPEAHTHEIVDVNGLQTALDGKADAGETGAPAEHTHEITEVNGLQTALNTKANAEDVYTKAEVYNKNEIDQMTMGEGGGSPVIVEDNLASTSTSNALSANQGRVLNEKVNSKADAAHSHSYAEITDKPATFTPETHTHAIADVNELQTALDGKASAEDVAGKADINHAHTYAEITDKPLTFPPDVHTHEIADVNNLQTTLDGKATTEDLAGKADVNHAHTYAEITDKPLTFPPDAHSHSYAEITNKPTTFTPENHTHAIADVTNLQTTLDTKASAEDLAGKADAAHSHSYAEITDKPATFTPEVHTHEIADVTNLQTTLDGKASAEDLAGKADAAHSHTYAEITDKPLTFPPEEHSHDEYITEAEADLKYELKGEGGGGGGELEAHTHDIADVNGLQTALNDKADAAHSHSYAEITDKPATFTPPLATGAVRGGARVGNGLRMSGEYLTIRDGSGIKTNADTFAVDVDRAQTDTWYAAKEALGGLSFWKGTQAEYDAIGTKDPDRIYFVV